MSSNEFIHLGYQFICDFYISFLFFYQTNHAFQHLVFLSLTEETSLTYLHHCIHLIDISFFILCLNDQNHQLHLRKRNRYHYHDFLSEKYEDTIQRSLRSKSIIIKIYRKHLHFHWIFIGWLYLFTCVFLSYVLKHLFLTQLVSLYKIVSS